MNRTNHVMKVHEIAVRSIWKLFEVRIGQRSTIILIIKSEFFSSRFESVRVHALGRSEGLSQTCWKLWLLSLSKYASISIEDSVFIVGGESFKPEYQIITVIAKYSSGIHDQKISFTANTTGIFFHPNQFVDFWKLFWLGENRWFTSSTSKSWNWILLE